MSGIAEEPPPPESAGVFQQLHLTAALTFSPSSEAVCPAPVGIALTRDGPFLSGQSQCFVLAESPALPTPAMCVCVCVCVCVLVAGFL